jgi:hypothetical protein
VIGGYGTTQTHRSKQWSTQQQHCNDISADIHHFVETAEAVPAAIVLRCACCKNDVERVSDKVVSGGRQQPITRTLQRKSGGGGPAKLGLCVMLPIRRQFETKKKKAEGMSVSKSPKVWSKKLEA